jgi:predicted acyltransferase
MVMTVSMHDSAPSHTLPMGITASAHPHPNNNQTPMSRALPLDALRGLAILLMVFSGRIPFGVLPDWMYHAQVPPPAHVFNGAIPGITWVDLVFPFFLFAMGAAIPLAIQAKLDQGIGRSRIVLDVFKRGVLLVFLAIYFKHITPSVMAAQPGAREHLLALTGFLLLFPMLLRLPSAWPRTWRVGVRAIGWLGAALVLVAFRAKDGTGFSVVRSDIIILVLANVSVSGALIWLATRTRVDIRVGILAFLFALRLTQNIPGWGQWLWNISPAPWIGTVYFQQYLFIIIPGTIAGDWLLRALRAKVPAPVPHPRTRLLAALGALLTVVMLVGMKGRWVVETSLVAMLIAGLAWWCVQKPVNEHERTLRALVGWGIFWLLLGLAFEPYEGGIKKDRATMSYYFVTSGLALFALASLTVWIDFRNSTRGFRLLIATGQNPLVAYAGVQSLLTPLLALTGAGALIERFTQAPWAGAARGGVYTLALAWVGAKLSQRGWVLRA